MNFTVGNVRITVSFLLAVGLCAGTLLPGHLLPLLWLAILLHECGHFIYIAAAGKKIGVICISLTGVRVKLAEDRMSRGQELLLNLSGPAVNLLFGGIMLTEKQCSLCERQRYTGRWRSPHCCRWAIAMER